MSTYFGSERENVLDLYRFIESMDVEDVALKNRGDYNVIDSGEWVIPGNFEAGYPTWGRAESEEELTAAKKRLSQMVWMERGRTDAKEVGKISVISGSGVRAATNVYDEAAEYEEGCELTIKLCDDKRIKLSVAGEGDVVKAICLVTPQHDRNHGYLHFEFVD